MIRSATANRSGATLTEVLMALLVASIGLTAVISIFPVAILRSIQATQVTNARMLFHNSREVLKTPQREGRVDGSAWGPATTTTKFSIANMSLFRSGTYAVPAPIEDQVFRGQWQPGTAYELGQIVTSTDNDGHWYVCSAIPSGDPTGLSGHAEPKWMASIPLSWQDQGSPSNLPIPDGGVVWLCERVGEIPDDGLPGERNAIQAVSISGATYEAMNYVVDPLGWNILADNATDNFAGGATASMFGYRTANGLGSPITTAAPYMLRVNGGAITSEEASAIVTHPDSWEVVRSGAVADWNPKAAPLEVTQIVLTRPLWDLSEMSLGAPYRLVLNSGANAEGLIREISPANITEAAGSYTVNLTEPLPLGYEPDGTARVETYNRRYSWLATVNKSPSGDQDKVTVAVFFNRRFTPADEHVYDANFGNTSNPTGWEGVDAQDQIMIRWAATEPQPLIRAGNYVLDGRWARWYRIVAAAGGSDGTGDFAVLTVDRVVPTSHITLPDVTPGRAILMKGIVELFEL